jgi:hypothetical protein
MALVVSITTLVVRGTTLRELVEKTVTGVIARSIAKAMRQSNIHFTH